MSHMAFLINNQALDLMKHGRVSSIMIRAKGPTRDYYFYWRSCFFHRANLNRRRVGAKDPRNTGIVGRQIKSVLFLSRRMLRRDI